MPDAVKDRPCKHGERDPYLCKWCRGDYRPVETPSIFSGSLCRWEGCPFTTLEREIYCLPHKQTILKHMWGGGCRFVDPETGQPCDHIMWEDAVFCGCHNKPGPAPDPLALVKGDTGYCPCGNAAMKGIGLCSLHAPDPLLIPKGTAPEVEKAVQGLLDEAAIEDILDEAKRITSTDRNSAYGHPLDNFQQTADLWTAFLRSKLKEGVRIEPRDVPWLNILQKASRDSNSAKRDNLVDCAGYARTAQMVEDERARRLALETPPDEYNA